MIKFLDLKKQNSVIKKKIYSAVKSILDGNEFVGGNEVNIFEKEFAKFCGAKYAISVNSGTDALFLSLKALGIGQDDEVITTPFTFFATAEAIVNCGARPVFVDIKSDTFNIDPELVERSITPNTKAIIPVHLFGRIANMGKIIDTAKKHKLFVVEDACQAIGAEYNGKKAGTMGDLGCFSFFPSKNLGAMGDGGMITTNSKKLNEKIKLLKNHGSSPKDKYKNLVLGVNSRLDAIQAAILNIKIKYLNNWIKDRQKIANYYHQNLRSIHQIVAPVYPKDGSHVFHQYTLRLGSGQERDQLKQFLSAQGVPSMIYYPLPLHLQPALKYLGHKRGDFPEAERVAKEVLSLPIYPELSKKEQDFIIDKIKEFHKIK